MSASGSTIRRRIAAAYSGLGERPKRLPSAFAHFECPRWRNPVMSPLWPRCKTVSAPDLARLEGFFRAHPKRFPFEDANRAYLTALAGAGGHDIRTIGKVAAARGWIRKDRGAMNVWFRPSPLAIPNGYHFSAAPLGKSGLHRDFLRQTKGNFKSSARFMRELRRMFPTLANRTSEVVFYSRTGMPAAAGLVTTRDSGAFLWCGSVDPRHRGRGLSRALVAALQLVSRADGADFWATSTENPRIAGKCDRAYKIAIFYKK